MSTSQIYDLSIRIRIRYRMLNIRTRIRTDLNSYKRIRSRIRSENIRTVFIPSGAALSRILTGSPLHRGAARGPHRALLRVHGCEPPPEAAPRRRAPNREATEAVGRGLVTVRAKPSRRAACLPRLAWGRGRSNREQPAWGRAAEPDCALSVTHRAACRTAAGLCLEPRSAMNSRGAHDHTSQLLATAGWLRALRLCVRMSSRVAAMAAAPLFCLSLLTAKHGKTNEKSEDNFRVSSLLGLVYFQNILQNRNSSSFVCIWQILSNYRLTRLKKFVLSISTKLCN